MMSRDEKHLLHQEPTPMPPRPTDPTRSSKTWAIALVVSAVFLLAAAGIMVWLLVRGASQQTTQAPSSSIAELKSIALVAPADMPIVYTKDDKSTVDTTRIYYYDDAAACGFTVGVMPTPTQLSVKEAATQFVTNGQAPGFTAAARTDGGTIELADADDAATKYAFDSVTLDQNVNAPGVGFTKHTNVITYKQFGSKTALVSYACKDQTWAQKQPELAAIAQKFTVKTER